jgi:hypothetical protein
MSEPEFAVSLKLTMKNTVNKQSSTAQPKTPNLQTKPSKPTNAAKFSAVARRTESNLISNLENGTQQQQSATSRPKRTSTAMDPTNHTPSSMEQHFCNHKESRRNLAE